MQLPYCVCFEYICFPILFVFPPLLGTPAPMGGRKSVSEEPGCWSSCLAACGVEFEYRHIPCLFFRFRSVVSVLVSAIAHLLDRYRDMVVHRAVSWMVPLPPRASMQWLLPCHLYGTPLYHLVCITLRLSPHSAYLPPPFPTVGQS